MGEGEEGGEEEVEGEKRNGERGGGGTKYQKQT